MKARHLFFSILVVFLLLLPLGNSNAAENTHPGFRVEGRFLYDNQGEKVILYGINKMIVWMDKDGVPSYSEIAKTGANCVRITWSLDESADDLDTTITNCRAAHMIPIVELHNATGDWSKLSSLVDFWVRPDIVAVIQKHQEYLLINIGNEVGQQVSEADFKAGYESAVTTMREAGIHVPLVIDASSYGQSIDILQSCGPSLIEADPDNNLMFSVHMWWPKSWGYTDQKVIDELEETVDLNLPLIVGEFGNEWEETESGQIPYKTIMEHCYKNQIGYLPWSWGPGNNPQTFLDMTTDGTYDTLNGWGLEVAVTDPYSIQNIAERPASMLSDLPYIRPGRVEFNKAANAQEDVVVTISANDNTFYGIKNDTTSLVLDTDYTVSGDTITIKKEYLAKQPLGITRLTFDFNQSYNPVLKVDVSDSSPSSSITPSIASFEKTLPNDIAVTMDLNGNTLLAIQNGSTALSQDTDYSINDQVVTLNKEYLEVLPTGEASLTFQFSAGKDQVLKLKITNTVVSAVISPKIAVFDKESPDDITITLTLNGNSLLSINNGSATLQADRDYSFNDNTVTIYKEYLSSLSDETTRLIFKFNAGEDAALVITDKAIATNLKVEVYNGTKTAEINTISPKFKLTNTGDEPIALSDVKIHYYYTKDGTQNQSFWCDWSHIGSSNVVGTFVTMEDPQTNADCYLEISFTSDAGNLSANESIEVQTRVAKSDWTNYNQSNDYSFNEDANSYTAWNKITAYISDFLISGMEP